MAAIATAKSAVYLGQIPDAIAPKSIQAQTLYGESWKLGQCWAFKKLTPHTEGKAVPSNGFPARGPHSGCLPTSLKARVLSQLT